MSKPPKHRGSLKDESQRYGQMSHAMYHESENAEKKGNSEIATIAREIGDNYANLQLNTIKKMDTVRNQGIGATGQRATVGRGKTLRAGSGNGDIVTAMLTIRNQVKLYHWQTKSFARHKATDDLTATLDTLIDSFVESYMGKYGRPSVRGSITLHNFSESAARSFVAKQTTYLTKVLPKKLKSTDTDLLNIRDEILGELNKVLYLFTLQ
jgi:hypothetical protein